MYNLEHFFFVEIKEYKADEIVCTIEHEESKDLLEFVVDHDNILEYYEAMGINTDGLKLHRIQDDYEDICSNLFIDLKTSENSESISGLHVQQFKTKHGVFSEHEILSL